MNILIDIGHPAHVHYFRNLYYELIKKHNVLVTTKSVPIILDLLERYSIPYINIGEKGKGISRKFLKQVLFTHKLRKIILENSIDLAMGVSFTTIHASIKTKCKSLMILDDDISVLTSAAPFALPFMDVGLSPDSLAYEHNSKVVYYPGFQELAYLHPNRYSPSMSVLSRYGIMPAEKYFILRFNAFKAHHDVGNGGMNISQKRSLVNLLKDHGRVYITTEDQIDAEFEHYKLPIEPQEIHDFLYYSEMLVSDSQTMSSEAAVLGVPSFRCNTFVGKISYLDEEEKRYSLTHSFLPRQFDWMLEKIREHLLLPDAKKLWREKRDHMLSGKIDVTTFWVWFIENYSESLQLTKRSDFNFEQFK